MPKRRRRHAREVAGPAAAESLTANLAGAGGMSGRGLAEAGGMADAGGMAAGADSAVVRRTPDGWRVGGDELTDLTCAMVLADLIAAELPAEIPGAAPDAQPGGQRNGERGGERGGERDTAAAVPATGTREDDSPTPEEARRLRATVGQLEHALAARIRIEQAIGVLAERNRIRPRQAFEQLRTAARSRGRRVIDIAADVVASASNPLLQLPEELSRQRGGQRPGQRGGQRSGPRSRVGRPPRSAHDPV